MGIRQKATGARHTAEVFVYILPGFTIFQLHSLLASQFPHLFYFPLCAVLFAPCPFCPQLATCNMQHATRNSSDIKLGPYLKHLGGRQIENIGNTGFFGNLFQIFIDLIHRRGNKREPDIVFIIALVIVGNPGIAINDVGKAVNSIRRHPGGTQGADKAKLSGNEISANSSYNADFF